MKVIFHATSSEIRLFSSFFQQGTFEELQEGNGGFADILNQFAKTDNGNDKKQSIEDQQTNFFEDDHGIYLEMFIVILNTVSRHINVIKFNSLLY